MNSQYDLYLERIDPGRNMQRFYRITIDRSLFGELVLTRRWGRIGTAGREKRESCGSEQEALSRLLALATVKRRRNYHPPHPVKQ